MAWCTSYHGRVCCWGLGLLEPSVQQSMVKCWSSCGWSSWIAVRWLVDSVLIAKCKDSSASPEDCQLANIAVVHSHRWHGPEGFLHAATPTAPCPIPLNFNCGRVRQMVLCLAHQVACPHLLSNPHNKLQSNPSNKPLRAVLRVLHLLTFFPSKAEVSPDSSVKLRILRPIHALLPKMFSEYEQNRLA